MFVVFMIFSKLMVFSKLVKTWSNLDKNVYWSASGLGNYHDAVILAGLSMCQRVIRCLVHCGIFYKSATRVCMGLSYYVILVGLSV